MRTHSVAVPLIAVLIAIVFFKKDDLIEARGGRGGGSRSSGSSYRSSGSSYRSSGSSYRSSSSRYSRSSSSSYSDRRRTGVYDSRRRTSYYDSRRRTDYYDSRRRNSYYDSRRRTDYSRRRSDYDYSRRRSYYNSGSNYGSTDSSGGGGFSPWIVVGIVFGVLALFLLIVLYLYHGGLRSLKYVVATPASDDVGPNTNRNIGPAEGAPTRYTPVLPSDPTGPVGYSTNQSPAFFSMGTGTSDPPTQASEAPQLPSQYPSSQYPPPPYPPATYLAHTDSGVQDVPTIRATITLYSGPYEPPGMQAPPLPLPPQIREELDNDDGGMPEGGYPPPVPPALPTSIVLPPSSIPPPPTVAPPVETVDEPSMHVSAPADAPPPSYNDLFKS